MWQKLLKFFREITTGRDNQSADIVRVTGLSMAVQYVWLGAANWQSFEPVAYGTGAGLMLAALGAAMRVARPTEPEA